MNASLSVSFVFVWSILANSVSPIVFSGALASPPLSATSPSFYSAATIDRIEQQRGHFADAIDALREGNIAVFDHLKRQLIDYPLYPYLEQVELLNNLTFENREAISTFLDHYQDQPVSQMVRSRYLYLLAEHQQTMLFLKTYQPTSDITLQCHWFHFRLQTNEDKRSIFTDAKAIWLHGKSRPDACDPLFHAMKKNEFLTDDLIWQRYLLALEQGQTGLMQYLSRQFKGDLRTTAESGIRMYKKLQLPRSEQAIKQSNTHLGVLVARIVATQIWHQPDRTLAFLHDASQVVDIPANEWPTLTKDVALALATKGHADASEWLNTMPANHVDSSLLRWKLANMLRHQQWHALDLWLSITPAPENEKNDWLYWQARAAQQLGKHQKAQELLNALSGERSYYGFLAAAKLGRQPTLEQKPYPFDDQLVDRLAQHPRAQMAKELWQHGRYLSARREWNFLKSSVNDMQRIHLAAVAHRWGWHHQAILSLAEQGLFDQVDMRFPLAFTAELTNASHDAQLDLSLSYAIARRESAFEPTARSRVGARGLMQLMPDTAKYIAKKKNLAKPSPDDLDDPKVNAILATHYLRYLLEQYNSNLVFAAASYNAGRSKVEEWIQNNNDLPADIWIEVVPYKETRAYIKNVLAYQQIYRNLLGQNGNQFNQIIDMTISAGTAK